MACFEDAPPTPSALDVLLQTPLTSAGFTAAEELRKLFMENVNTSLQARARTVLWYAAATELRTLLAMVTDLTKLDDIKLCYRATTLGVYAVLARYKKLIEDARDEVAQVVSERVLEPIDPFLASESPVHVVSAAAMLVILAVTANV